MSAALRHSGLPEGVKPHQLISLVKTVARAIDQDFRISRTAIALLEYCVGNCREADFHQGKICGTWEQPATIAAKLGISTKVLHNAEAELREKCLIERTSIAHARRRGERRNSEIVSLAGISLRPLIDGYAKLVAIQDAMQLQQQAVSDLRQEIGQLRLQIRQAEDGDLAEQAEAILPRGRTSRITRIEELEMIKADLETLLVCINLPSGDTKSSVQTEEIVTPIIPEEDSSQNRSDASERRRDRTEPVTVTPATAARLASEDYRALLDAKGGPTWRNLVEASATICTWIGISQSAWGDACQQMGRERAALCVLIIDRNSRLPEKHRYRGRKPDLCLKGMAAKGADNLNLMGLLQAVQGYPEGAVCSGAAQPPNISQWAPEDATAVGRRLPSILANMKLQQKGGAA